MKRRLFTILSALSLLLFAVTVWPWGRGSQDYEQFECNTVGANHKASYALFYDSNNRTVWIVGLEPKPAAELYGVSHPFLGRCEWRSGQDAGGNFPALPFPYPKWFGAESASDGRWAAMRVPWWFIQVMTGLLPLLWVLWFWKRKRAVAPMGLCRRCGYDLRATPDRCPECGTIRGKAEG
jgi:hypothetical protein